MCMLRRTQMLSLRASPRYACNSVLHREAKSRSAPYASWPAQIDEEERKRGIQMQPKNGRMRKTRPRRKRSQEGCVARRQPFQVCLLHLLCLRWDEGSWEKTIPHGLASYPPEESLRSFGATESMNRRHRSKYRSVYKSIKTWTKQKPHRNWGAWMRFRCCQRHC